MCSVQVTSVFALFSAFIVAPEMGVKEGGGECELMRCCREELHTNIVQAGQEEKER